MKKYIPLAVASIGMMILLKSGSVYSHSEHDKSRFVAQDGQDKGLCDNRARPCKTISYATQKANKGDKVLVASGTYEVTEPSELLYLVSQTVPVIGGYDTVDLFQTQNPNLHSTTLTGVPLDYADALYQQGFNVVSDTKGEGSQVQIDQGLLQQLSSAQPAATCLNGRADIFPCNNIDLLSHIPLADFPGNPNGANDIWGHVDLNSQREYAIIGLRNGIVVVDLLDPENPRIVGRIAGQQTTWRDIKVFQRFDETSQVWQAFAYVTADSASEGTVIIDLNQLPDSINVVSRDTTDLSAHNVYISNVDYSLGITNPNTSAQLHIGGSNQLGGSFRSYSLNNPTDLQATYTLPGATRNDYAHDLSSLTIDDSRATTQCVNAVAGTCLLMLDFNENQLRLWDHSNPNSAVNLSNTSYPNVSYVHSGWWSEDRQFVFVHDELDERDRNLNTTLRIFELNDLTSPTLAGTWTGPTAAIDHNGFVRGNRYYMSNYERGLTVLDITDPTTPVEVGSFDTFPSSDNTTFNGAWGVYPYLPSGIVLVSDINTGLYVLRDNTTQSAVSELSFSQASYTTDEGESLEIVVNKTGTAAVEVSYETVNGSASEDDFSGANGTLTWDVNDQTPRTITVPIQADTDTQEFTELFFVRLFNPRNGAALAVPNLSTINITGAPNGGTLSFTQDTQTVRENQDSIEVMVSRVGGSESVGSIDFEVVSGTATVGQDIQANSGTLTFEEGDTTTQIITVDLINDTDTESLENFFINLSNPSNVMIGANAQITIDIRDDESNQPPIVSVNDDQEVNTRAIVNLSATASDPEGQDLTYIWSQISGDPVTIDNPDQPNISFTAPDDAGELMLQVDVADDFGLTVGVSAVVTVVAPAPPPPPPPPAPTTPPPAQNSGGGGGGSTNLVILLLLGCVAARRRSIIIKR